MPTVRPMVFVGCGGSGGKTLRLAHDAILRRLHAMNWKGGMPDSWQFLWIDVPLQQEGGDMFGRPLDPSSYHGLVKPGTKYLEGVDPKVTSLRGIDVLDLVGWRPNPAEVRIPLEQGAGQFRAVGRMIALKDGSDLMASLQACFDRTAIGTARAELEAVARLLNAEVNARPSTILVSSLAGGSGAGMFLDVADMIRCLNDSGDTMMGLLYTADVFGDVTGAQGVESNALAALAELLAAHWQDEERRTRLLRAQGIPSRNFSQGGPAFPFLIGAKNSQGICLNTQAEVYRSVGDLLALVTVSPEVQEKLLNFGLANWQDHADHNRDQLGIQESDARAPVSSLGYARMGLGRDRFELYVTRRLARAAVEFLATGYLAEVPDSGHLTPDEVVGRLCETHLMAFLDACGLNEKDDESGERHDQIVQALMPASLPDQFRQLAESIRSKQAGAPDADLGTWVDRMERTAEQFQSQFATSFDQALAETIRSWTESAPDRLLAAASSHVARLGIPVTLAILTTAKATLTDAKNQMMAQADDVEAKALSWKGVVGRLNLPLTRPVGLDHPKMTDVLEAASSPFYRHSQAKVYRQASRLLGEFIDQVLSPLTSSLHDAQQSFTVDTQRTLSGEAPEYLEWPVRHEVPQWLQPSQVEFLLDDVDRYPGIFEELVVATLPASEVQERGISDPFVAARQEVISGGFPTPGESVQPLALRRPTSGSRQAPPWQPVAQLGGQGERLTFLAEFRQADLVARAEAWVMRPGAFADYLHQSLTNYLSEDKQPLSSTPGLQERLATFEAQLGAALAAATPLIDVDVSRYDQVHAVAFMPDQIIEPLPFPPGHPARGPAEQVLKTSLALATDDKVAECFAVANTAGVGSIGIVSYLPNPVHPIVIRSVTEPIRSRLQQSTSDFWVWRRSRPLTEFVPISGGARRAMLRGWFTGRLVGLVDASSTHQPARILSGDGIWLPFPHPPLGGFVSANGLLLAGILESLPVAWLDWSGGHPETLQAYRELFRLGLSDPDMLDDEQGAGYPGKIALLQYDKLHPVLREWLTSGKLPDKAVDPLVSGDDSAARTSALENQCDAVIQRMSDMLKAIKRIPADLLSAPRGLELAPEAIAELQQIRALCAKSPSDGPVF